MIRYRTNSFVSDLATNPFVFSFSGSGFSVYPNQPHVSPTKPCDGQREKERDQNRKRHGVVPEDVEDQHPVALVRVLVGEKFGVRVPVLKTKRVPAEQTAIVGLSNSASEKEEGTNGRKTSVFAFDLSWGSTS